MPTKRSPSPRTPSSGSGRASSPGRATSKPSQRSASQGSRCVFREGSRKCFRNGFGDPPLCRAHSLSVDYEIDLDDPVGSLIEHADRFLSSQKGELVQTFARSLGDLLRPRPAAGGSGPSPPAGPPPPRPPRSEPVQPPPSVKESPRDVLGFDPKVKLTKAMVKERQRTLAKLWHPDHGGSTKALQRLNAAVAELMPTLK